jgi:hypothetical protein
MATWKKVIVSGSVAELNVVSASAFTVIGSEKQILTSSTSTVISGSFSGSFSGALTSALPNSPKANFVAYDTTTGTFSYASTGSFTATSASYISSSGVFGPNGYNSILSASNAQTASFVTGSIHTAGNLALSASYAISSSNASTASFAQTASAAFSSSYSTTASYALSYAPVFPYSGSAQITGSLGVTGSINATSFTGSFSGTSSYATQAATASFITGSIYSGGNLALSSSFALTASFVTGSIYTAGNLALSSSNATSASYALTASYTPSAGATSQALTFGSGLSGSAASFNGGTAVTVAVSGAVSLTTNTLPKWSGTGFINSNISDTGTAVSVASNIPVTVNSNLTVTGDLTVAGTASFQNTQNLLIGDRFIALASGSTTLTDAGIIAVSSTSANGMSGSAFYLESVSTGTYGRWAVANNVNISSSVATVDEYAVTAKISQGSNPVDATPPTWGSSTNGMGNMWITNAGDIFIYS